MQLLPDSRMPARTNSARLAEQTSHSGATGRASKMLDHRPPFAAAGFFAAGAFAAAPLFRTTGP
jgi:hypothetical protein